MNDVEERCIVQPERDCLGLHEAKHIKERIEILERSNSESHQRLFTRLEELEKGEAARSRDFAHLLEKLQEVSDDLRNACDRLSDIEKQPGNKWESLKDKLIGLIAAAVVGFALAKIGIG